MKTQDVHMQVGVAGKVEIDLGQAMFPDYMQRLKEKITAIEATCENIEENTDVAIRKADEATASAIAATAAKNSAETSSAKAKTSETAAKKSEDAAKYYMEEAKAVSEPTGLPVGFEYFSVNPNIPLGSLPLLGGEFSRAAYKDLWDWAQTQKNYILSESAWQEKAAANGGNVPFYSSGNGSTTFRVPSLKCWIRGANGIEEVGSYLAAGLPNIEGAFYDRGCIRSLDIVKGDSVLFKTIYGEGLGWTVAIQDGGTPIDKGNKTEFNAANFNSIYGSSNTVQPQSVIGIWLVKAYSTVTNTGNTDVSALAQGLTTVEQALTTAMQNLEYDFWHRCGNEYVPSDTSNAGWGSKGIFISSYGAIVLPHQPSQWGQLINIPASQGQEATQIWIDQTNGEISTRRGNPQYPIHNNPFRKLLMSQELFDSGNSYARFNNGLQICWGQSGFLAVTANNVLVTPITFAVPFLDTHYRPIPSLYTDNSSSPNMTKISIASYNYTTTGFDVRVYSGALSGNVTPVIKWLAIGRWK